MSRRFYLYPVWIRLWHMLNAILFLILIFTGVAMQYASGDRAFSLISFENAVSWHNVAAIILTLNYVVFVLGNIYTKNGRYYRIRKENFWSDLFSQLKFYSVGMFKKEKHPFPVSYDRKFNPLQKISYVLAMYVGMPVLIITGIGLLFPEILVRQFFGLSGLVITDLLHIAIGFILSMFLLIHIYTCTLGDKPLTLFKSLIDGYHEEHE
ncbi:MAG: cytochrome b/b6 domain-containing protein [Bacteroidales bacterium]|nr:cytochrome b/b6 domain-containing protein [Bacteroidales bacterium]